MRGTCKNGHVTEREAAPGRVTWSGKCEEPGCELEVRAKRIPTTEESKKKDETPSRGSRVVKVDGYESSERAGVVDAGRDGHDGTGGARPASVDDAGGSHEPAFARPARGAGDGLDDDEDDDPFGGW